MNVAGQIRLKFKDIDRISDTFILHRNENPLFGAVPMKLIDLVVTPIGYKLNCNPKLPNSPYFQLNKPRSSIAINEL